MVKLNTTGLPTVIDNISPITAITVNRLRDAILSLSNELGVKPSGTYSTVRARLDAVENLISNIVEDGLIVVDATDSIKGKLKLTNDFGGTADLPLVTGLQSYNISSVIPTDGYVLTWDNVDAYWAPRPSSISFIAGGDLSGTSSSQTVIGLQGNLVNADILGALQDGYVLTWENLDGYWAPRSVPQGFTAGGDLSGTTISQTVIKLQGNSINADILGALQDGYVLSWSNATNRWAAEVIPTQTATGSASGDLNGNYPSPTVSKIQNRDINSAAPTDGYVLTWDNVDAYWVGRPTATQFTAGGDLSGTSSSQTVSKINATTITTAGGALTTGKVLRVTGVSTVDYGAVDLANASAVTGILPNTNQASQSMGGDVSGTTASATVIKLQGNAVNSAAPTDGYILTWSATDAYWVPRSKSLIYSNTSTLIYSPVLRAIYNAVSLTGDYTAGQEFRVTSVASITGIRFRAFWSSGGARTYKVTLWNQTDNASLATATSGSCSSGNTYEVLFASPVDLTSYMAKLLCIAVWDTTASGANSRYLGFSSGGQEPTAPIVAGPNYIIERWTYFAGDHQPTTTSASERYSIEPIFV